MPSSPITSEHVANPVERKRLKNTYYHIPEISAIFTVWYNGNTAYLMYAYDDDQLANEESWGHCEETDGISEYDMQSINRTFRTKFVFLK